MTASQSDPAVGSQRSPRAASIVAAARRILEEEGRDALTMRRLGAAVGIRAPSLYKHFPDKSSVEVALIEIGFEEMADVLNSATILMDHWLGWRRPIAGTPSLTRTSTAWSPPARFPGSAFSLVSRIGRRPRFWP